MDTDSRQQAGGVGQFPASFPDTFKNFFSMLNEDDDHEVELYSNLLEDKIIPRSTKNRYREYSSCAAASNSRRSSASHGRSSSFRLRQTNYQQAHRASASEMDARSNGVKHMRYCGLYHQQEERCIGSAGGGGGSMGSGMGGRGGHVSERQHLEYNISDDEKRRKQFGKFIEHADEAGSNEDALSDNCDDSDTVSTSSSNNTSTVPYSFLVRHPPHHPSPHHHHQQHPSPQSAANSLLNHMRPLSTPSIPIHHLTSSSNHPPPPSTQQRTRRGSVKKLNHPSGSHVELRHHISQYPADIAESSATSTPSPTDVDDDEGDDDDDDDDDDGNDDDQSRTIYGTQPTPSPLYAQQTAGHFSSPGNSGQTSHHHGGFIGSTPTNGLSVDKINICSCKPSDLRAARSPVPGRRRASSIATTTAGFQSGSPTMLDHRYVRMDGGGGGLTDVTTLTMSTATTASSRHSGGSMEILHNRFAAKSPLPQTGPRTCSSVMAFATFAGGDPAIASESVCVNGLSGGAQPNGETAALSRHQRQRTSSMPAENNRKPRLADTRRAAIHCADVDLEYYRLRSFSITSHGICNLGDSMRKRRSVSSVTSTGTAGSDRHRNNSNASQVSHEEEASGEAVRPGEVGKKADVLAYKVAMLGDSGVGKTALTYQFTTSEYICAYDLSLDDDYGQKTVSVLLDGQETDLEIIDHPACEMSTEAFCSTYNIDIFVVVYSVLDRKSFKEAEKILHYLKGSEMLLTRGAILVGNKTDVERQREVTRQVGRQLAKEVACKFIETSSGLDHNVNELLVGIVAQVKLNPMRFKGLSAKQKIMLNTSNIQKHRKPSPGTTVTASVVQSHPMERRNATNCSLPLSTYGGQHVVLSIKQSSDDDQVFNDDDDDVEAAAHRRSLMAAGYQVRSPKRAASDLDGISLQSAATTASSTPMSTSSKISLRTKYLLTSFLRFKRSLRTKRRNSGSCSDLFAI